jgi:ATP/maltotriose-dependent transcriptional regulator MalT
VPYRGECLVYRVELEQLAGAWADALRDATQACELLASPPNPALGTAYYRLGDIRRLRGELDDADEAYRRAMQAGRRSQPGLALLRLAQGNAGAALQLIRTALDETSAPRFRARLLPAFVEIAIAASDLHNAGLAADELFAIALDIDAPLLTASAAHALGAHRLASGDAKGARPLLRQAGDAWRALGMPYESARSELLLADACDRLGDTDTRDVERMSARERLTALGAKPALAALESYGARTPGGLSDRELQVLRLVASGLTNRAIAEALFISEKTVARHISNIFNKLGVSSRAAATAQAYQRQIV